MKNLVVSKIITTFASVKQTIKKLSDMVKVKIYDAGPRYTIDRYTVYFPVPKQMIDKLGYKGVYLGCSPSTFDGRLIRCCWDCVMKEERINRKGLYFGRRVKLKSFPAPFKEWIEDAAKVWDDAVTKDTEECWKKWKYF